MSRFFLNKWTHRLILFALLHVLLIEGLKEGGVYLRLQNIVFDTYNQKFERPRTDDVIIVTIDDKSLEKLGQWPWPRSTLAKLVDKLVEYEAASIAFDGVLAEPDRLSPDNFLKYGIKGIDLDALPNNDKILADSIKKSKRYVTAFTYATNETSQKPIVKNKVLLHKDLKEQLTKTVVPFKHVITDLDIFEKAARGNGSFMATPDYDGILRKTGVLFTDGKELYPSLSAEAVRVGKIRARLSKSDGLVKRKSRTIGFTRHIAC